MSIKKFFKNIIQNCCCSHEYLTFVRNIYGDEINHRNGKRSVWKCDVCGKLIYKDELYNENISKRLNDLVDNYYKNLENKWINENLNLLSNITRMMEEKASEGYTQLEIVLFLPDSDWNRLRNYFEKLNIVILNDKIDNNIIYCKKHTFTLDWNTNNL